jgi:hypothetical protein
LLEKFQKTRPEPQRGKLTPESVAATLSALMPEAIARAPQCIPVLGSNDCKNDLSKEFRCEG